MSSDTISEAPNERRARSDRPLQRVSSWRCCRISGCEIQYLPDAYYFLGDHVWYADIWVDGIDKSSLYKGTETLDIYSLFLEYEYEYSDELLFVSTLKYEYYKHDYNSRVDEQFQFRLGAVSLLNDEFTFKAFYSNNKVYPALASLAQFPYPRTGNPTLKAMSIENYSSELIYNTDKHRASLGYSTFAISDPIKLNETNTYFNGSKTVTFKDFFINYTYLPNKDHKIMLEYYSSTRDVSSAVSPIF